jgi:hypothetical protein
MLWNGNECRKTNVMKISRQQSSVHFVINKKQMDHVENFNYLQSIITSVAICTCKIESRIAMEKAVFDKKKTLFTSKLNLNLRKKLVRC